jgi:hypothetical protein
MPELKPPAHPPKVCWGTSKRRISFSSSARLPAAVARAALTSRGLQPAIIITLYIMRLSIDLIFNQSTSSTMFGRVVLEAYIFS